MSTRAIFNPLDLRSWRYSLSSGWANLSMAGQASPRRWVWWTGSTRLSSSARMPPAKLENVGQGSFGGQFWTPCSQDPHQRPTYRGLQSQIQRIQHTDLLRTYAILGCVNVRPPQEHLIYHTQSETSPRQDIIHQPRYNKVRYHS